MIGYARWVTFDDPDTAILHFEKNRAEEKFLEEQKKQGVDVENSGDPDLVRKLDQSFRGLIPRYKVENELKAWAYIREIAERYLGWYPNTLEEDIELLSNDKALSFNQKNCILYRKGEKEILKFLINCSIKVNELSKMSLKEARQAITMWTKEDIDPRGIVYFKEEFCELLK